MLQIATHQVHIYTITNCCNDDQKCIIQIIDFHSLFSRDQQQNKPGKAIEAVARLRAQAHAAGDAQGYARGLAEGRRSK